MSDFTWSVRNCFIPREGYKIFAIDYAGLELASTAHQLYMATGRHEMLDLFNAGDVPVDPHSIFGAKLKSTKDRKLITYEEFLEHKKEPGYKEYRQYAKPINLGFPGGIGYDKMRVILAGYGIFPKLEILNKSINEENLIHQFRKFRYQDLPVRIRRVAENEYHLVYDELVDIKNQMFSIYPDLEHFLKEFHKNYLTGASKKVRNPFGESEEEPMYRFEIDGFVRDNCTYTQFCNGYLMQSPAAVGAKRAMCRIIEKYGDSNTCNPLAFIHDEIVGEVVDNENKYDILKDISNIMIDEMQAVIPYSRITVEAGIKKDGWDKEQDEWTETIWKQGRSIN